MKKKITKLFLHCFDWLYKKKIIKFIKKKRISTQVIFDVGGHQGESIIFFSKNFCVNEIHSFEPIYENFKKLRLLSNRIIKKKKIKIFLENSGCGANIENLEISMPINETSSSTLKQINFNSSYFIKKNFLLNLKNNIRNINVNIITLSDYIKTKSISKIDFLKIDTEGFEYEVLLGLKNQINNVGCILFEHHYDDMITKNYKFSDVNKLLTENNFLKVLKLKMFFRKTFEYIYINKNFYETKNF